MNTRTKTKKYIYRKHGMVCYICGIRLTDQTKTIDHVKPLSLGGKDHKLNMRPCCLTCNKEKANIKIKDYTTTVLTYKAIDLLYKGVRIPLDCVR